MKIRTFNANWQLERSLALIVAECLAAGTMSLKPLQASRDKSEGVMAESGTYEIEWQGYRLRINDYAHYFGDLSVCQRRWALKAFNGLDPWYSLARDDEGNVYFNPYACRADFERHPTSLCDETEKTEHWYLIPELKIGGLN